MKLLRNLILPAIATLAASSAFANDTIPFRDGYQLGDGVDSISGQKRGACVMFSESISETLTNYTAQQSVTTFDKIESSSEFSSFLGLEAEASYSSFASAKMDFKNRLSFNEHTLYVLVKASAERVGEQIKTNDVKLTPEAWELLENQDYDRFKERCGSGFIGVITSGGEFFALYQFQSESREEFESLNAEAKFSYGVAKGSAEFEEKIDKLSKVSSVSIDVFANGDAENETPVSAEDALEYAKGFRSSVFELERSVGISVVLWDYTILNMPPGAQVRFENAALSSEVQRIESRLYQYDDAIANLDYALSHPDQFDHSEGAFERMSEKLNELTTAKWGLVDRGMACLARDLETCKNQNIAVELVDVNLAGIVPERTRSIPVEHQKLLAKCDESTKSEAEVVSYKTSHGSLQFAIAGAPNTYVPMFQKFKAGTGRLECIRYEHSTQRLPETGVATGAVDNGGSATTDERLLPRPNTDQDQAWIKLDPASWKSEPLAANCTLYTLSTDQFSPGRLHISFQKRFETNAENEKGDWTCVNVW